MLWWAEGGGGYRSMQFPVCSNASHSDPLKVRSEKKVCLAIDLCAQLPAVQVNSNPGKGRERAGKRPGCPACFTGFLTIYTHARSCGEK